MHGGLIEMFLFTSFHYAILPNMVPMEQTTMVLSMLNQTQTWVPPTHQLMQLWGPSLLSQPFARFFPLATLRLAMSSGPCLMLFVPIPPLISSLTLERHIMLHLMLTIFSNTSPMNVWIKSKLAMVNGYT